jgi:hypothetical protein
MCLQRQEVEEERTSHQEPEPVEEEPVWQNECDKSVKEALLPSQGKRW